MTEHGPDDIERRQDPIDLEHRLTKTEESIKHYDKAQEVVVSGISGLHKRFTDLKDTLCKTVKNNTTLAEKNEESIAWIKGRPRRVFTLCLEILGGVGVLSAIAFAIFRTIKMVALG